MNVVLDKYALKALNALNEPIKSRIRVALYKLECEPPQGDIKRMQGSEDYRVRVGGYRILFKVRDDQIVVADIAPRGQVYKGV